MIEIKYCPPEEKPEGKENIEIPNKNIPEIIIPPPQSAADIIPDEVPRKDGPGGE